jgi:hypothetical protein
VPPSAISELLKDIKGGDDGTYLPKTMRPISTDKSGSRLLETPIPDESITGSAPILPLQSVTDMAESYVFKVIGRVV